MELKKLQDMGAFVSPEPELKTVTWKWLSGDDKDQEFSVTVRIKHLSCGVIDSMSRIDPEDPDRSFTAVLISKAVLFGEEGNETITYHDAYRLRNELAQALRAAILDVNAMRGSHTKN